MSLSTTPETGTTDTTAATAVDRGTRPPGRPEPDTSLDPTLRQLWRRSRWFLAAGLVLLLAGLLLAGLGDSTSYPALDPRSPDPDGTKAISELLHRHGVTVTTTTNADELADAPQDDTVLVPLPELLTTYQLRALGAAGHRRLVLLSPDSTALELLAPNIQPYAGPGAAGITSDATAPDCTLGEAEVAGTAEAGGRLYQAGSGSTACYPRLGHPTLVRATGLGGAEVIVLGSGRFLTNEYLAHQGNASLALGLLGSQHRLVWYLPDYGSAGAGGDRSITELIPGGWSWATLQLAVAVGLAALWRARRLGPLVSEQLPVVVRATETTEGRARLYQLAKARGRAAEALRQAVRHRLAPVLGVSVTGGQVDADALLAALGDRLPDRPAGELGGLLYGPPPLDDAALLRLADELDALERQVRQP
ncbi:DUF4350 domain-containing protein [Streptomyces tateyamensis]|uniref:DUF4350 domain-containing protein n=1 Tax=Streptomyces tateyamensis TaxID=565073 RepID=A0A2V4MT11_9ACTN|nr:DUF4350 domain-containing protein [Streptomyces tateyamensis]PYC66467.1 DUF4350 domain-containing protein [Streptomyces tateyamensis]